MIIEGNIQLGRGIKITSSNIPYGEVVFTANTVDTYSVNEPRRGTANATYRWTVPAGVTSISVLCIGGGGAGGGGALWAEGGADSGSVAKIYSGGGGGGGGLVYSNNLTVVPGTEYVIQVGAGGQRYLMPYDAADPDYGDASNSWGVPRAMDGGPSFFTTNAAIVAHQTPLVQANGGAGGFTNTMPTFGLSGVDNKTTLWTLQGGGGGGAAGYKGAGGAGGSVGPLSGRISGGNGGTTSGTKKTAGFSGGAGGAASWIDQTGDGDIVVSNPGRGSNPAAGSGGGAGGSAEFILNRKFQIPTTTWKTISTGSYGPGTYSGAYGGGGIGIYGAGDDGKTVEPAWDNQNFGGISSVYGESQGSHLNTYAKYSGSGGADGRYDQTLFEYSYLIPNNIPGLGASSTSNATIPSMSQGAAYGGGGGADFYGGFVQQGVTGYWNQSYGTFVPIPGMGVGAPGAVRIVWPGTTRQFPSTRVQQINQRLLGIPDIDQDTSCEIEIVCVAGGGCGGEGRYAFVLGGQYYYSGGGGAGGGAIVRKTLRVRKGTRLVFYIGAGGGYQAAGSTTDVYQSESDNPNQSTLVAQCLGGGVGGSGGAAWVSNAPWGHNGGSGGGCGGYVSRTLTVAGVGGGIGTPGQGSNGYGQIANPYSAAGGGGGCGIMGDRKWDYASSEGKYNGIYFGRGYIMLGGGGGGGYSTGSSAGGSGGLGGGGYGALAYAYGGGSPLTSAGAGAPNTGGGGGGGSGAAYTSYTDYYGTHYIYSNGLGARGGSGIAILHMPAEASLSYTISGSSSGPSTQLDGSKLIMIYDTSTITFG